MERCTERCRRVHRNRQMAVEFEVCYRGQPYAVYGRVNGNGMYELTVVRPDGTRTVLAPLSPEVFAQVERRFCRAVGHYLAAWLA